MSGDLLGLRPAAAEHGLSLSGRWRGIYFGILESDNGSGNAFSQEVVFNASLDLAKALRWEAFGGLTAFGEGRWRDAGPGANPDNLVEADSLFNPSRYAGGTGWRMVNFGLRMFSLFYFAPAYDNDFSFYVHGGFAYEGLVPGRDRDQVMIGAALGQYGDRGSEAGQTVLIEAGYRFRINHWSFAQPFAQYLVRPGGTDAVADAAILGVSLGVDF